MPRIPEANSLQAEIKDLKARLARLERSARVGNTTISNGALKVIEPGDRQIIGYIGQSVNPIHSRPDGQLQSGTWLYRDDVPDSAAFMISSHSEEDEYRQMWRFTDRRGNAILWEDRSGYGLGWPLTLQGPWYTPDITLWPSTTDDSFQTAWYSYVNTQQPTLWLECIGQADSGTTGEIRIVFEGRVIDTAVVPENSYEYLSSYIDLTGYPFGHQYDVEIQYRRTSGSGNVRAALRRSFMMGTQ